MGNTGEEVTKLQKLLISKGYSCGSAGADGDFGQGTYNAVVAFQKANGLDADGIVGANTWNALNKPLGPVYKPTNTNDVLIFQSKRTYEYDENGKFANDLKVNDYTADQLLAINSLFKYQLDRCSNPEELFEDFRIMTTKFFSIGEMEDVVIDMINHFKKGTGTKYSNSVLTKNVIEHQNTQTYIDGIKSALTQQLKACNGDLKTLEYSRGSSTPLYEYINNNVNRPVYNLDEDILNGLTITIDDIWGHNVTVKDYKLKDNHFSGTLHFSIYDHFGLDEPDVQKIYVILNGFRAWYVLQHYKGFNGAYKPFITNIEFDIPFEGTL